MDGARVGLRGLAWSTGHSRGAGPGAGDMGFSQERMHSPQLSAVPARERDRLAFRTNLAPRHVLTPARTGPPGKGAGVGGSAGEAGRGKRMCSLARSLTEHPSTRPS